MSGVIRLTRGKVALVDEQDLAALSQFLWTANVCIRKGRTTWRASRWSGGRLNRRTIMMHRAILGVTDPNVMVDHRNGDGLDNRRVNLRLATRAENQRNRHSVGSRSGFRGVRFKGVNLTRPWAAEIVVNRRSIHLGYFADKEDAARAYDAAAHEHFGAFASPNFPREVAL